MINLSLKIWHKLDHIKDILDDQTVSRNWMHKFGTLPGDTDAHMLFNDFNEIQCDNCKDYMEILPETNMKIKSIYKAEHISRDELQMKNYASRYILLGSGADFVIDNLNELPSIINKINSQRKYYSIILYYSIIYG